MNAEIATNRKAFHEYHILDRFEAGIALKGTEVKSIRLGLANLHHAFARVENGEVILHQADIQPYVKASHEQHEPRRPRKLLLHRHEILKLAERTAVKGCSLPALRMFWKNGKVKVEIGVGKGKSAPDKRHDLKARESRRETDREVARFHKRRG